MAAAVTERLVVGTGICLVAQREPIVTAKAVATLDRESGGRFVFGIGFGWNADEIENHGVDMKQRRDIAREHTLAMQALWNDDVGSFDGEYVHLAPSWSWPKPANGRSADPDRRCAGPEVVRGGGRVRRRLDPDRWRRGACRARRPRPARARSGAAIPKTLRIVPFGTVPDAGKLEYYESIGIEEVVLRLPGGDRAIACSRSSTGSRSWSQ